MDSLIRDFGIGLYHKGNFSSWMSFPWRNKKTLFHLNILLMCIAQEGVKCAVFPKPILLAHINDRSSKHFCQRTRHVALLRGQTCTVEYCFGRKSEEPFCRDAAHLFYNFLSRPIENVFRIPVISNCDLEWFNKVQHTGSSSKNIFLH